MNLIRPCKEPCNDDLVKKKSCRSRDKKDLYSVNLLFLKANSYFIKHNFSTNFHSFLKLQLSVNE